MRLETEEKYLGIWIHRIWFLVELDLGQRQRRWGTGSETLIVRGMPKLWLGEKQALLLGWTQMPGPEMDGIVVCFGLGRGDIQSLILTMGCLRAFHISSVGINAKKAAGCPNLGLQCVFRVVMGILAWHACTSCAWMLAVITQWQLPTSPTSKMKS